MSEPAIPEMFQQLMDRGMRLLEMSTRNATRIDNHDAEIMRARERNHEIANVLARLEERQIAMDDRLRTSIQGLRDDVQFLIDRQKEN